MVLQFWEESGRRLYTAALHTVMFMLAGVFKGSHVTLEVRQPIGEWEVLRWGYRRVRAIYALAPTLQDLHVVCPVYATQACIG